ncbi:hypothetical protein H9P43_001953 [Blastocladiella emersonii ATCC 22665]|nr:hypothetical protein H9P43_001953 [Blastocladiella emersonii ATCC 22665]
MLRACRSLAARHRVAFRLPQRNLSSYDASAVESKWQTLWREQPAAPRGPNRDGSADFSMVFPPPNVTGNLHCGHALTVAVQDAMVRWNKLHARSAKWIPGTDHAGIATQSVVEKQLAKRGLPMRQDLGRDAFLEHVWAWKNKHGDHINSQLRALGADFAWNDAFFTLDAPRSRIVRDAFVALHDRGLVYRATRLVHWCPALETAISDMEVDHLQIDGPTEIRTPRGNVTAGLMHRFAYPVEPLPGSSTAETEFLEVATTRVETMLGDMAVAVHPTDPRYAHLVGRTLRHPLRSDLRIPVIADAHVDPELGTGAVKVTPAHDPDDFAIGQRHNLPSISLLDERGKLTAAGGVPEWTGLDRFAVRAKVIDRLSKLNLYRGAQPHTMRLGVCSRSGDIIEPRVVPQWYVRCAPMANKVLERIDRGDLVVLGTHGDTAGVHERELVRWLESMQDWCVSRQLWWGHRIPAFRAPGATGEDAWRVLREDPRPEDGLVQDADVLDTWFSSALLPLSATNPDLDLFAQADVLRRGLVNYPTSLLETGQDILFFWVARMAMLCTELSGDVPFRRVLLHGMVRDAQGRKMSKSLGNVVDPLHVIRGRGLEDMIEDLRQGNLPAHEVARSQKQLRKQFPEGLPSCGADALRLTLLEFSSSRQINLDVTKIVANYHFANKLYNVAKFAAPRVATDKDTPLPATPSLTDAWLLHRVHWALGAWNAGYEQGTTGRPTQAAVELVLADLSDTYIEFTKKLPATEASPATLAVAVQYALALLHPTMPHLTAELYDALFGGRLDALALADLPALPPRDQLAQHHATFDDVWSVVRALRKRPHGTPADQPIRVLAADAAVRAALQAHADDVARVGRVRSIVVEDGASQTTGAGVVVINPDLRVVFPVATAAAEQLSGGANAKLVAKLEQDIARLEAMMASEKYAASVPAPVRERDARKLASFRDRLAAMRAPAA